jgi:hypothetical protein
MANTGIGSGDDAFLSKPGNTAISDCADGRHSIHPNPHIDIPILDCNNDINERVICYAVSKNMRINITAVCTYTHISIAYHYIKKLKNDAIISVFAGGMSDAGLNPSPFIAHAKRLFCKPNVKILWMVCRELYTIQCAEESGCDIVALPGGWLDTLHLVDLDLDKMSVGMVYGWRNERDSRGAFDRITITCGFSF